MISLGFIQDTLEPLRRGGFNLEPALQAGGFSEADLALPGFRLSAEQYGRLWLRIAEIMQCEYFGFGARPMAPGSFAMLCHAVISSQTLEHAVRRSLRFLNLVLAEPKGELQIEGSIARIVLRETSQPRPAFAYRTYFLLLHGIVCWLVKRQLEIRELQFRGPLPPGREDHRDFFGTVVSFERPETTLVFDAEFLALKVRQTERTLQTFITGAPANILGRYRYDRGATLATRRLLREHPAAAWPSFAEVAVRLGMSEPTLRRHLAGDGQSFSEIKEEIRRKLALDWLSRSAKPVGEIATDLGYAEPSAFHRAFHKWAGMSPGAFRRTHGK
ncbi:AraC family transcriptional regulator [Labrys neptuniae]